LIFVVSFVVKRSEYWGLAHTGHPLSLETGGAAHGLRPHVLTPDEIKPGDPVSAG